MSVGAEATGKRRQASQAGLLLAIVVFVAIALGVLLGAQRFIADANQVAHTRQVIAHIDAYEVRLREAEAAQRGYLLTGNVDYLAEYRANRQQLAPLLDELARLVADNPEQQRRVGHLRRLGDQRLGQIDRNLQRYHQEGLAAAQSAIGDEVLKLSGSIRGQARQLLEQEQLLLRERDRSSRHSANLLRVLAVLGIPFGILVVGLVYQRLVREIRRRSRAERDNTEANARLVASVEQLEHHVDGLAELNRYGSLLLSCGSADEAVELTARLLVRLLPDSGGTLYRMRASADYAEAQAHWGVHAASGAQLVLPSQCWALRRGRSNFCGPQQPGPRCAHVAEDVDAGVSTACVPLAAQGTQLGFIYISTRGPLPEGRMPLVQSATEQLSMALHNLDLQERLRLQSIREPLTGLYNRRYLEESLARELARCERRGLPLSLLMLDLDHFKAFNDLHGHAGGDALLAAFGQLLQQHARAEDIPCRYGGEEFTLILPEADTDTALACGNRIVAAARLMRVPHLGQELPAVTVSVGLATWQPGENGTALMRRADAALYQAKRTGRDRVAVAG